MDHHAPPHQSSGVAVVFLVQRHSFAMDHNAPPHQSSGVAAVGLVQRHTCTPHRRGVEAGATWVQWRAS